MNNVVMNQNTVAGLIVILFTLLSMVTFFGLFIFILQVVARWQVFRKMKVASWKSLIPFYSDYCIWSNVWKGKNYIIYLIISVITSICGGFIDILTESSSRITQLQKYYPIIQTIRGNKSLSETILLVLSLVIIVLAIVLLVFNIKLVRRYAKAFGKGGLMAFALFILPGISEMILGFGMSQYLGNKSDEFAKKS